MKRLKALLLALAMAAGVTLFMAPAPAHAAPPPCDGILLQFVDPDGKLHWFCLPLYIEIDRDPRPEPCLCPDIAIQVVIDHVLPRDIQRGWADGIGQGLTLLSQAADAPDARTAGALRGRAQDAFLGAARLVGDTALSLGGVGSADPRTGAFEPAPMPWFEETAESVLGGSRLMQVGFCDPQDDPWWWFNAGMERFEAAQIDLDQHAPVGV